MGKPRRKRRWLRARGRSLEITTSGWLFIGLSLLVGFAAINSGSNLLHAIFGAMLALIVGSGVLSEATVRRVVARRLPPGAIHAGVPAPLLVELSGVDRRDVLAVRVEDHEDHPPEEGHCDPAFAVRVPAGGTVTLSSRVVMPRRGPASLPPAVVSTRFPFGLFIKRRIQPGPAPILVYPPLPAVGGDVIAPPVAGDEAGAARRARAGEFFGLREYRDGDDPRRLYWPAVARLGRPVVREMETGARPTTTLDVPDGTPGDPAFEEAIEHTAAQAVALLDAGGAVALARSGTEVVAPGRGPAQRRRVLDCLALAGFDPAEARS